MLATKLRRPAGWQDYTKHVKPKGNTAAACTLGLAVLTTLNLKLSSSNAKVSSGYRRNNVGQLILGQLSLKATVAGTTSSQERTAQSQAVKPKWSIALIQKTAYPQTGNAASMQVPSSPPLLIAWQYYMRPLVGYPFDCIHIADHCSQSSITHPNLQIAKCWCCVTMQ